jgi:hypothetical protein
MKIIRCKWFPPKGFCAITLVWVIIAREGSKISDRVVNHESIHVRQQKEMLILFFLLWYGLEFLVRLLQYRSWDGAYRNISFEREAYANEGDAGYLGKRRCYSWTGYLRERKETDMPPGGNK